MGHDPKQLPVQGPDEEYSNLTRHQDSGPDDMYTSSRDTSGTDFDSINPNVND